MNKNTIPLIIIVIVIICFGLGGLALVIHNIKNDKKHMLETESHHHEPEEDLPFIGESFGGEDDLKPPN